MTRLPEVIFVVGAPGSGKSTFCEAIKQADSGKFDLVNDVEPLKEIFSAEREISCIYAKMDFAAARNFSVLSKKQIRKFPQIWERYINHLDADPKLLRAPKARCIWNDDGFDILDSLIWQEIIAHSVTHDSIRESQKIVLEFARGAGKDINEGYGQAFKTAIKFLRVLEDGKNALIVHVKTPLDMRMKRNLVRKEKGEHYISEKTMNEVYGLDPLEYSVNCEGFGKYMVDGIFIPIFPVENILDYNDNLALIRDFSERYRDILSVYVNHFKKKLSEESYEHTFPKRCM